MTVRRLAAVDLWGSTGTRRRRRIVLAEFVLGVLGAGALGLAAVLGPAGGRWVGLWLLGVAVNYLPLAGHALSLSRPGALEAELAGVDVPAQLRRYGLWQFLIAVPLLMAVLALVRRRRTRFPPGRSG